MVRNYRRSLLGAALALGILGGSFTAGAQELFGEGTVGMARAQLQSVGQALGVDLSVIHPVIVSGEAAIEQLAGTCPGSGYSSFDLLGEEVDNALFDYLSQPGVVVVNLHVDAGVDVFLFAWDWDPLEKIVKAKKMLAYVTSSLCGAGLHQCVSGSYGANCGGCMTSNACSCFACPEMPILPGDEVLVSSLPPGTLLPNWE